MSTDAELLHQFVADHSDAAFTELVHRHLPLVRATALRRLGGNFHAADDVIQQVFVSLARKAASLQRHTTLAAWLYVTTHHATAENLRKEQRRKQREATAHSMHLTDTSHGEPDDASRLRPFLDDALITLKPIEREAIVLRYFANHTYSKIGKIAQLTEEAARKRVERALEKLHVVLMRRGVTSSLTVLGGALTAAGLDNAPIGLAAKVAGAALMEAAAPAAAVSISAVIWPIAATAVLGIGILATLSQRRANAAAEETLATLNAAVQKTEEVLRAEESHLRRDILDFDNDGSREEPAPTIRAARQTATTAARSSAEVFVTPEGTLKWNDRPVKLDKFISSLIELNASAPSGGSQVVVKANGTNFSHLVYVLEESRKAGINSLVIESDTFPDGDFNIWF